MQRVMFGPLKGPGVQYICIGAMQDMDDVTADTKARVSFFLLPDGSTSIQCQLCQQNDQYGRGRRHAAPCDPSTTQKPRHSPPHDLILRARRDGHLHLVLLPGGISLLPIQPPNTVGVQFHIEIPNHPSQDSPNLGICQAVRSQISISSSNQQDQPRGKGK